MKHAKALLTLGLLSALACSAWCASFTTVRFNTTVNIQKDRTVEIQESITVDFTTPQHGIIRRIPYRTTDSKGNTREVDFDLKETAVSNPSGFEPADVQESRSGNYWVLKIGSASRTMVGRATFIIVYVGSNILTDIHSTDQLGDRTEFLWNVIPNQWPTSIDQATASVAFPNPAPGRLVSRILIGPAGTRYGVQVEPGKPEIGDTSLLDATFGSLVRGSEGLYVRVVSPMKPGDGLTVLLSLPPGTVNKGEAVIYHGALGKLMRMPKNPLGFLLPLLAIIPVYLLARSKFAPDPGPLVVKFDPPANVGPSECGVLIDGRVNPRDIVAGIVSIAQKGAAHITHTGSVSAGTTVELKGEDKGVGLTPFEHELYTSLMPFGNEITPETLRGNFGADYNRLSSVLYAEPYAFGAYRDVGGIKAGLGCMTLGVIGGLFVVGALIGTLYAIVGAVAAFAVCIFLVAKISPLTPTGSAMRQQILGLKEFITRANQKELNYMAETMPDQAMFERLLPYAVAFDAVKQWTEAFHGIDIQMPDWYSGYGNDNLLWSALMVDDFMYMNSGYSDAVSYGATEAAGGIFSGGGSGFGDLSGGYDSGGGGFDSGFSSGDGGGGGGGDSW